MDSLISKQFVTRFSNTSTPASASPNMLLDLATSIFLDGGDYADVKISVFGNIPVGVAMGFFVRYAAPPFPPLSNIQYSESKVNNTAGAVTYSDSISIRVFHPSKIPYTHLEVAVYNTMASAVGTISIEALVYKL